jgi:mannose-6-phosphate isomerase-like protein (cupin superfamily)
MTNGKHAQTLSPVRDDSMPAGVRMWVMEPGTTLPTDCPVSSARFVVDPGASTEVDIHDVVEVWTVTAGRGTVLTGGTSRELTVNESIFFPTRVDHQLVNSSDAPVEVFSVWWRRAAS